MPRTKTLSAPASPAGSLAREAALGGLVAIHQPNLFPRLSTLAKLFAADCWVVLDDVQFARRDFQHRARLGSMSSPSRLQWLSIPTHLPDGRSTLIKDAVVVDPQLARRRTTHMLTQHYSRSPDWPILRDGVDSVLQCFDTARMAAVAEESTKVLLRLLGWRGQILRSSRLPARAERSQRLADLTAVAGARGYLCGTGGMSYLVTAPFEALGLSVVPFVPPKNGFWRDAREASSVGPLMTAGIAAVAGELRAIASCHRSPVGSA
ncbi:WbqC family protein [Streptomyces sp. NPDC050600]|uniref:WbqC family protein n=1 Tax=Streptomyces sp. NPDC050600 TaxID=3157213 RepID=UPI0034441A07